MEKNELGSANGGPAPRPTSQLTHGNRTLIRSSLLVEHVQVVKLIVEPSSLSWSRLPARQGEIRHIARPQREKRVALFSRESPRLEISSRAAHSQTLKLCITT